MDPNEEIAKAHTELLKVGYGQLLIKYRDHKVTRMEKTTAQDFK